MDKKVLKVLVFAAVIFIAGFLFFNNQKNAPENETVRVCVKDNCYEVEIADDPMERARGLMFRQNLDEDKGMLFVFENSGKHSFWMKNTLIALDIIWIDERGKILHISQNTPPCESDFCPSYAPEEPSKYVLEVAAGQTRKIGAAMGDKVNFEL